MGREGDALTFFRALAEAPFRHDFYQTMRRLECLYGDKPRWGEALRPIDEPVRLGQDADLSFAPAALASFETRDGTVPRLQVRLFGLLGPNGPLPIHLTEYVRERLRLAGDPTLSRFLDIFHHRFVGLFYQAWAQAQPHVNRDRPAADRFTVYVGALIGMAPVPSRNRDALPDLAKFFHVGVLTRQVRNAEGLVQILQHFFRVPMHVEEFVGHWLGLAAGERTSLSSEQASLGSGAVLGCRVWDRQHRFRIRIGPLSLDQYESFLPGGVPLKKLVDWVRMYLCFELDWDVCLVLACSEVPRLRLDGRRRLGWTTWLGRRRAEAPADDLRFVAEAFVFETHQSTLRGARAA
jgi:type VI secretion system protein ImpH